MKFVLIVGDEEDPHIKGVCEILKNNLQEYLILNPYNPNNSSVSLEFEPFKVIFGDSTREIYSDDVGAIWWRFKPKMIFEEKTMDEVEIEKFVTREWMGILSALEDFLEDKFWINPRSVDTKIRNKPYQLSIASSSELKIPKGIITNNFAHVMDLNSQHNPLIYKPLSYLIIPSDRLILYANLLSNEELVAASQNISRAPSIYQEYIEKDYELRITVIGEDIYPVKIYSQTNENTIIDWRKDQLNLEYELVSLDPEFEESLRNLHNNFNLIYGAYDFIVTPEGEHVFLEVNPVGQWLWLEEELGLDISQSIADLLSSVCKNLKN